MQLKRRLTVVPVPAHLVTASIRLAHLGGIRVNPRTVARRAADRYDRVRWMVHLEGDAMRLRFGRSHGVDYHAAERKRNAERDAVIAELSGRLVSLEQQIAHLQRWGQTVSSLLDQAFTREQVGPGVERDSAMKKTATPDRRARVAQELRVGALP